LGYCSATSVLHSSLTAVQRAACLLCCERERGGRQPGDNVFVGDQLPERFGGVEHVVAELGAQLGQLLRQRIETLLVRALSKQRSTSKRVSMDGIERSLANNT
jgi:hypothetical protein